MMSEETIDTRPIANLRPHYTNEHYKTPRTVWLAKGCKTSGSNDTVKGAKYNSSDRIWQWNWNKAHDLSESIDPELNRASPAYIQEFLRRFFDKPHLTLVHVMAGFNLINGYPYQVCGYIEVGEK